MVGMLKVMLLDNMEMCMLAINYKILQILASLGQARAGVLVRRET